ncbi:MAG: hypothetical protein HY002_06515, partial [Candidatus Rokubacteria bacterium]|nr:hypothetical protein [Candidatus Rokubacteria bacterium]
MARSARRPVPEPAAAPAPRALEPRTWQGIVYRPCQAGAAEVRRLFDFAGAWAPQLGPGELAWEALADARLAGGVLVERHGEHGFIHGPVVVEPPRSAEPLDVAAQLIAPLLQQAAEAQVNTLFTRPQGLDRLWVRFGFVPVPEAFLPAAFRNRPGTGLHAWRRPGTYTIAIPEAERGRRRGR